MRERKSKGPLIRPVGHLLPWPFDNIEWEKLHWFLKFLSVVQPRETFGVIFLDCRSMENA